MHTIYWAGDSTVQTNDYLTYPQTGIGQIFNLFLKEGYAVSNHAKNGRSTKSFLDEGRLKPIKEQLKKDDFLWIQFGHNDEKIQDPTRYTHPTGDYLRNLKVFITAAREKGAHPLLITSLERRCFDENGLLLPGEHQEYVNAMKRLGEEESVPVVDLHARSRRLMSDTGDQESKKWFMNFPAGMYEHYLNGSNDNTHLRYEGAVAFALLIAQGVFELESPYKDMILEGLY
jgi:lysophospholipase L1-like esterase